VFAVRPLAVLFFKCWDRSHAAVIRLTPQPANKSADEQGGVQPVGLCPTVVALYRYAGRVDDIGFDASRQ